MPNSEFIKRFPKPKKGIPLMIYADGDSLDKLNLSLWENRRDGWIAALERIKLELTDETLWTDAAIGYRIRDLIKKEIDEVLETLEGKGICEKDCPIIS